MTTCIILGRVSDVGTYSVGSDPPVTRLPVTGLLGFHSPSGGNLTGQPVGAVFCNGNVVDGRPCEFVAAANGEQVLASALTERDHGVVARLVIAVGSAHLSDDLQVADSRVTRSALRPEGSFNSLGSGSAALSCRSLVTLGSLRSLRSLVTSGASVTLGSLRALRTSLTLGSQRSLCPSFTLGSQWSLGPFVALLPLFTLNTLDSLGARRSGVALHAASSNGSLGSDWPLRPDWPWRSARYAGLALRSALTLWSLGTFRSLWSLFPSRPFRSLRPTRVALVTLRAFRSLYALVACWARRSLGALGAGRPNFSLRSDWSLRTRGAVLSILTRGP